MQTFVNKDQFEKIEDVKDAFPSAAKIVEVCGGWICFETLTDFETWRNQK